MKRASLFVFIIAAFGAVSVFSAEPIKDGFYDEFDPNGVRIATVQYELGVPHGRFRTYFPDGRLKSYGRNINGQIDGLVMEYYDNGKPHRKSFYRNGQLHGEVTEYFPSGRVRLVTPYIDGWKDGVGVEYDKDGRPAFQRQYRHNQEDGVTKLFFPTGGVFREYDYVNGVQHGKIREYYADGRLKGVYEASNGIRHGIGKEFYSTGELMQEGFYERDRLNGPVKTFYRNGKLRTKAEYVDGYVDDDTWREYYENGALHWLLAVKSGLKQGKAVEYDENGQMRTEGTFVDDQRQGVFRIYDTAGWLSAEETYEHGRLVARREFFESGAVKSEQRFYLDDTGQKEPVGHFPSAEERAVDPAPQNQNDAQGLSCPLIM